MLTVKHYAVISLVLCLILATSRPAHADIAYTKDSKAVGVIAAVVAVGVVAGFGIYYAVHHGHSLKGCATSSPSSGLELVSEDGGTRWTLMGATEGIRSGDRVRVAGNRLKGSAKTFSVTKLSKDFGACPVH